MPLSKRHIDRKPDEIRFDPAALGAELEKGAPGVDFALLLGSAKDGVVGRNSDLDIAVYTSAGAGRGVFAEVEAVAEHVVGGDVRVDVGVLNRAEPVYRFEALKGRLLFRRDEERWLTFFSVTCRLYEYQMRDYERQRRYRLERAAVCG